MLPATHLIDAIGTSYLDLLAAAAGCTIARPSRDYGVDGTFQRVERLSTGIYVPNSDSVDFQLKTTTRWQFDGENLVIDLSVRAYNLVRWRSAGITPLYLIVVCLDPDETRRLDISSERLSIAGRAFWWSEAGATSDNTRTVNLRIPRANALTQKSLQAMVAGSNRRVI